MAMRGREIKVHFTFVRDRFASARPLNFLIIYSIPSTSGSYNFILVVCVTAGKGWYQNTSFKNSQIPKLDLQTHQEKCSLD